MSSPLLRNRQAQVIKLRTLHSHTLVEDRRKVNNSDNEVRTNTGDLVLIV